MTLVVGRRGCLLFGGLHVVPLGVGRIGVFPELIVVAGRHLDVALDAVDELVVVHVGGPELVVVLLRAVAVVASARVVVLVCLFRHAHLAFALRMVVAQRQMHVEVGQEVEAVVGVETAHEARHVGRRFVVVQQADRIARCAGDGHAVGIGRLIVAQERVVARIDWSARIVSCTAPDGVGVGETGVAVGLLEVDIEFQVVVEQCGRQRKAAGVARHIVGLEDAVLIAVAERQAVGQHAELAGDAQIVVGTESGLEDFVVPVGVNIRVEQRLLAVCAIGRNQTDHVVAAYHVGRLGARLQRIGGREGDFRLLAVGALLGRDDDDAVRCTRAVDCGRCGILQDGHALDVVRVDERQEVATAAHAAAHLHRHTVEHDERVVGGIERCTSTDSDCAAGRWRSAAVHDLHAAHLAVDELLGRIDDALVEVLAAHARHRTCQVALALHAVADDDGLLQDSLVLLQLNLDAARCRDRHGLRLVAHERHADGLCAATQRQREVAVVVCNHALRAAHFGDGCANQGLSCFIGHSARQFSALGQCDGRNEQQQAQDAE